MSVITGRVVLRRDCILLSAIVYVLPSCHATVPEPKEPPPKTYTMKDKFEYFKPCVQVEMDNPDKQETVTEIFIRGQSHNSHSIPG